MRRSLRFSALTASLLVGTLALAGCGATDDKGEAASGDAEKKEITVGFNQGPYFEMFTEGIQPILEADGYTVKTQDFTDGIIINVALDAGEIDANIMQHPVFLESINAQEGLENVALVQVPGPPMALFGGKKDSLDDVETGSTVIVPNQPANQYRAFKVLEEAGLITTSPDMDSATASPQDIAENPHELEIIEMENAQQVAALQDADYNVIQGNFVISGGLKLTDALALEDLTDEFSVVVAVAGGNEKSPWAQAIKDAYESDEFAEYVNSNDAYDGYNLPAALED